MQPKVWLTHVCLFCGRARQNNTKIVELTYSGLDMTDYTHLYYFDPADVGIEEVGGLSLCVRSCPTEAVTCLNTSDSVNASCPGWDICLNGGPYGPVAEHPDLSDADRATICPSSTYPTDDFLDLGGRCIPTQSAGATVVNAFWEQLGRIDTIQQIFADFRHVWKVMLYILAGAFGVTLLLMFLMRYIVAPLVYSILFLGWIGMGILTYFLFATWRQLQSDWDNTPDDSRYDGDERNLLFFKITMIISLILFVIATIVLLAMRERIRIAVNIMKEASIAIASMPQIFLSPVLTYFFLLLLFAYWLAVFMYLATAGTPYLTNSTHHVRFENPGQYTQMVRFRVCGEVDPAKTRKTPGNFTHFFPPRTSAPRFHSCLHNEGDNLLTEVRPRYSGGTISLVACGACSLSWPVTKLCWPDALRRGTLPGTKPS
jgi:hypothetical protein